MYLTNTIEKFENGRMSKLLEGVVVAFTWIKNLMKRYAAYRQAIADRRIDFYFKNHQDIENYQRQMLYYASAV